VVKGLEFVVKGLEFVVEGLEFVVTFAFVVGLRAVLYK
jgi:hypothetical protein